VLYHLHQLHRALVSPAAFLAEAGARVFSAAGSWPAHLPGAARVAAGYELFHRLNKDYPKPRFDIGAVTVDGVEVAVVEKTVLSRPFCRLLRFKRHCDRPDVVAALKKDPVVLLVAPLSGHHATLLRDTARTLLASHKVYVTDWTDARTVPLGDGAFTLDDYVDHIRQFVRHIGSERLHVIAVCQATVPVLAAAALMAAAGEPLPKSLVLMGGPVDARRNPTRVNDLATTRSLDWFRTHAVHEVPAGHPGRGRRVCPGFLQLGGFVAMNPLRHWQSHLNFYQDVAGADLERADAHRRFYDEYNAVLDMPAEYYLDCIRIVFQQHLLPRGLWHVRGQRVAPEAITDLALLTIEGQLDDISGLGQTQAAHDLCSGVPDHRRDHLVVEGAGHYGIFSGHRWRETVYPHVRDFIAAAT
jgi:poly(3-hydroxybutyrate) depolymerase